MKRKRWEVRADLAREQAEARIAADPRLSQWLGGTGPGVGGSVYAARSQEHAESLHLRRMAKLIEARREAADPPEPHLDCPYCPGCALACGTADREDLSGLWVACGACGYSWQDRDDREQAERADRAYANHLIEEEQRAYDAARLGPELLEVNARLLEQAEARLEGWTPREQLAMFPT